MGNVILTFLWALAIVTVGGWFLAPNCDGPFTVAMSKTEKGISLPQFVCLYKETK